MRLLDPIVIHHRGTVAVTRSTVPIRALVGVLRTLAYTTTRA